MLPVDLTSTWIPLSLLAVLCAYMFVLFQRERRATLAFDGMEAAAPAAVAYQASHGGEAAPAAEHAPVAQAAPPAPVQTSHAPAVQAPVVSERRRPRLLWRTASIWLPFVGGFAGQAYFDIIAPLMEKAAG